MTLRSSVSWVQRPRRPGPTATAGWAAVHGALLLAGWSAGDSAARPALVWPAAGSAFLWLLVQPSRRQRVAVVVLMTAETLVVSGLVATPALPAVVISGAGVVQVVIATTLVRRWCPRLLGAGGGESVHDPSTLALGTLAVTLATAAGALVAGLASTPQSVADYVDGFTIWWATNATGIVVVGACGHLLLERWQSSWRPRAPSRARVAEATLLLIVSLISYLVIFVAYDLPLAFLGAVSATWVATRFSTLAAAWHTALFGTLAVVATLVGSGPFAGIGGAESELVVTQAYLLTIMLIALALASGRDQRDTLTAALHAEQREATARAELLDTMTEALDEGIVIVNPAGQLTRANSAARAMLQSTTTGYQHQAEDYVVEHPDGRAMDPSERPSHRALSEGRVLAHDLCVRRTDGARRTLSVSAAALARPGGDGSPLGVVVVYRDVTDLRRERQGLLEFAENVSHDLRSPLTAARGWLDLASMAASVSPVDVDRETLSVALLRAVGSIDRMTGLIEDFLEQATAEGAELELEPLDLSGPLGLVGELHESLPREVVIDVHPDIPAVMADRQLVGRLLANLLGNAAKYVATGTVPHITISGHAVGPRVVVRVTDNGIGIPPADRELVFSRLFRSQDHAGQYAGTGLGLALCRTIVERHGGMIYAEDVGSATSGTTFVFDLPLAPV
ncbi:ATP-binding protein [Nocardioides rubriscoriae]|uniref:ATP-binding protein n=1 Tax=Nocardioides rubriscoriae TaxID=642762 RepID=UPI0011DFAD32|nr:ATP-binding protein [Nocardioides rubriscoriae]